MPEDENPFENVPEEFAGEGEQLAAKHVLLEPEAHSPILGEVPSFPARYHDKSRLAMGAGFGFVFLAVVFYIGVVMDGRLHVYIFGISGMVLSALVAFFYMLDDLRIRPVRVTERGTRFVAGILLALLFLLTFAMVTYFWPDIFRLALLDATMVLTNASFALFLYSMLWEE